MQKEQPQSLESQLQMARPRRSDVKRVPLTAEEKEFLGKIMDKAVAAEKAGELAEALGFYTEYKNELLKIKEKEKEIVWTREKLEEWIAAIGFTEENFVEIVFDLSKLPALETKQMLNLTGKIIDEFPANMLVSNSLILKNTVVKKWKGSGLRVFGTLNMNGAIMDSLPENTRIDGDLILNNSSIKDLPDDLYVGNDLIIEGCTKKLVEKAERLKEEGKIKGDIMK